MAEVNPHEHRWVNGRCAECGGELVFTREQVQHWWSEHGDDFKALMERESAGKPGGPIGEPCAYEGPRTDYQRAQAAYRSARRRAARWKASAEATQADRYRHGWEDACKVLAKRAWTMRYRAVSDDGEWAKGYRAALEAVAVDAQGLADKPGGES